MESANAVLPDKSVFTGKVVDADGSGIPGVNVVIKGTNTGTVTDIHGNYQLVDDSSRPTLVFTFIGYSNVEAVADTSTPTTVTLSEDLTQLSEIVVAGYGVSRTADPAESTYDFAYPFGGRRAYKQYLEKSLQYPQDALLNNVEGRVTVTFSVETTGILSDFKVVKGIGSGCDEEVIRLIKSGPKWTPTKRDDVAEKSTIKVRMRFQLPKEKKNK
jgi:TonB family protein